MTTGPKPDRHITLHYPAPGHSVWSGAAFFACHDLLESLIHVSDEPRSERPLEDTAGTVWVQIV